MSKRVYCEIDDYIIEELEKVKGEIEKDKELYSFDNQIQKGHNNCLDILNYHIKELKGE